MDYGFITEEKHTKILDHGISQLSMLILIVALLLHCYV